MVDLVLVFGVSTGFFSSGISTRFTVFFGSDVIGLVAAGAIGFVVTGVVVAVVDVVVSVVSPLASASAAAS